MKNNQLNTNHCDMQEWIDTYLGGEMKAEEVQVFEKLMANDTVFRQEVELQAQLIAGIITYNESIAVKSPVSQKLSVFKNRLQFPTILRTMFSLGTLKSKISNSLIYRLKNPSFIIKNGDVGYDALIRARCNERILYPSLFSGFTPMSI